MEPCTPQYHNDLAESPSLFCDRCGVKLTKPSQEQGDYITLMACTNPRKSIVAWMHYDKPSDSYTIKKCSDALSLKGAESLAIRWAKALKLEVR